MRVRIKFTKEGCMKYIGHLDVMRYFQKALRRAEIPVKFSEGFSPHMLMSFASPLGVGITSIAEYFDLDLREDAENGCMYSSEKMLEALNAQMVEGVRVLRICRIEETKAARGMTLVAAASYTVSIREGKASLPADAEEKLSAFLAQKQIMILRKTKRSEKETDIRPWIHEMKLKNGVFSLLLSAGSVNNLKPQLVMNAFFSFCGYVPEQHALMIRREEIYANPEGVNRFVPLEELGVDFG